MTILKDLESPVNSLCWKLFSLYQEPGGRLAAFLKTHEGVTVKVRKNERGTGIAATLSREIEKETGTIGRVAAASTGAITKAIRRFREKMKRMREKR